MYKYTFSKEDLALSEKHAALMCLGFKTYSFKNNSYQNMDVYQIGKLGELLVHKYLLNKANNSNIKILHTPFREDYSKLNFKDDFQVTINETLYQIEVRTKARNVAPKPEYECCTDCIKPGVTYVFASIDRQTNTGYVLGWANWKNLSGAARETIRGTSNNNFTHKVTEFNILIKDLYTIEPFMV